MSHLAFSKSLSNGTVSITTAGDWDELKYQLSKLDYLDTDDWNRHFAWENFRSGYIINDAANLWRYINVEIHDVHDQEIFEGRVMFLAEIDPVFG